jgi:hypothetical protein
MIDRERKINVEKMDLDQADVLQKQLSGKLTQILENAAKEANQILNIYGMEVKVGFTLKKAKKAKK